MRVSVLMPSFNHASYIMHSVRSVLDQTVRDLELLIVDDGSSDGTRDILRSVTDRRVSIRFFDRNRGACAAMNEALGMASGDIIGQVLPVTVGSLERYSLLGELAGSSSARALRTVSSQTTIGA